MTSAVSGNATATTTSATPGASSGTRATDRDVTDDGAAPERHADPRTSAHRSLAASGRPRGSAPAAARRGTAAGGAGPPTQHRRSALHRPAQGGGRLRGDALLLPRLGPVRPVGRALRRGARGRRGVALPGSVRGGRGRARGSRTDRRLVRL